MHLSKVSKLMINHVINRYNFLKFSPLFTALHGMQTRSSDEISVCVSACPSVRQTRGL